jgi:hypothetical protein
MSYDCVDNNEPGAQVAQWGQSMVQVDGQSHSGICSRRKGLVKGDRLCGEEEKKWENIIDLYF